MIEWCNINEGFASVIISAISVIIAIVAIFISFLTARKQNKIVLFEKRFECYQRLMELKRFSDFANRFNSFEPQSETNPIYDCQQEYLQIHGVLADERRAQLCRVGNMGQKYAMDCLDKDIELFTSIQMLFGTKKVSSFPAVESALVTLVKALFIPKTPSEIKSAQEALLRAFTNAEVCCNSLRCEIKMRH